MAVGVLVSLEEYLHTSYRPDCDYVDGEVRKRHLGEFEHSSTQGEIGFYLRSHYAGMKGRVLPEQRVQVQAKDLERNNVYIVAGRGRRS